jgi:hypothetical protein
MSCLQCWQLLLQPASPGYSLRTCLLLGLLPATRCCGSLLFDLIKIDRIYIATTVYRPVPATRCCGSLLFDLIKIDRIYIATTVYLPVRENVTRPFPLAAAPPSKHLAMLSCATKSHQAMPYRCCCCWMPSCITQSPYAAATAGCYCWISGLTCSAAVAVSEPSASSAGTDRQGDSTDFNGPSLWWCCAVAAAAALLGACAAATSSTGCSRNERGQYKHGQREQGCTHRVMADGLVERCTCMPNTWSSAADSKLLGRPLTVL